MNKVPILVCYDGEWEKHDFHYTYKGGKSKSKGILVPNDILYIYLLDKIYDITKVNRETHNVQMKYMYNVHGPSVPVEIEDDSDVCFFLECNMDQSIPGTSLCISSSDRPLLNATGLNIPLEKVDDNFVNPTGVDREFTSGFIQNIEAEPLNHYFIVPINGQSNVPHNDFSECPGNVCSRRRMDAICVLPSLKRHKIDKGEKVRENEDRISQLPDGILHHILSLLPTKDAVATCILSTRWQNLWISVTNLDLKCNGRRRNGKILKDNSFSHFVEMVLLRHSSNIKKFRLSLSLFDHHHESFINSWILAAVRRQVQELCLSLPSQAHFLLPDFLCSCKTLMALEVTISCNFFGLPRTIYLPNLTVLHLCGLNFVDDVSIHKLFSGLPVLEELKLTHCKWNMLNATISIPTLKSLTLDFSFRFDHLLGYQLRVCAKNLIRFSYTGDLAVALLLDNLSLLVDASICVQGYMGHDVDANAARLFHGIRFAKSIKIGNYTMKCLNDDFTMEEIFPKFGYLTSLKVNEEVMSETADALKGFLENSPILESLVVRKVCGGSWVSDCSIQCPLLRLKTCILQCFRGQSQEISFLKFVWRRCAVLERIKLYRTKYLSSNPEKFANISKQLEQALPNESKSCVIEFL